MDFDNVYSERPTYFRVREAVLRVKIRRFGTIRLTWPPFSLFSGLWVSLEHKLAQKLPLLYFI